jgi:uncharacterized membrane protein
MLAMLSGHYSVTYSHPQNGLVLILMMFAGAAIRQFFVMRHGYKLGRNGNPLPYALVGVVVIVWLRPEPPAIATSNSPGAVATGVGVAGVEGRNGYKEVKAVLAQRCYLCHGEQVQMKNVRLDSPQSVQTNAQNIYQQVVVTKLMPMNNSTGLTEPERLLIKQWFEAGANTQ